MPPLGTWKQYNLVGNWWQAGNVFDRLHIDKKRRMGDSMAMDNAVYFNTLIQPKDGLFFIAITLIGIVLVLAVLFALIIFGIPKGTALTLTENELIIKSPFYGRKIPIENIIIDGIKPVNLNENQEYAISLKTNGIGMPGLQAGWMRLKNGERALTFVTDKNNVVLIPTKEYLLLFSMNNIDEFIAKVKSKDQSDNR
jgi:hypothetical protein